MTIDELENELESLKRSLFQIRVRSQTEKVENTAEVRNMRKDIARIKTILKVKNAPGPSA
jgi:large subunit ribosomal protein L29